MQEITTEQRFRHFLLGVTAFIFIGTVFELALLEHYEETIQWAPFIVSVLGLIATFVAWKNASSTSLKTLRWVMGLVILGSLLGVYMHLSNNWGHVMREFPDYTTSQALFSMMKGPYPMLAPGILFLAGVLGIAATYRHPLLEASRG